MLYINFTQKLVLRCNAVKLNKIKSGEANEKEIADSFLREKKIKFK